MTKKKSKMVPKKSSAYLTHNSTLARMKLIFVTKGSWGDIQPVIVLGHALLQKNHTVKIATHARYESVIRKHGIDFAELPGDPAAVLESKAGQQMLAAGQGLEVVKKLQESNPPSPQATFEACEGMDLIVSVTMTQFECYCAAELLKIPYVRMSLSPLAATSQNPAVTLPFKDLKFGFLNMLTHELVEKVWWTRQAEHINKWRVEKGLIPVMNWFGMTPLIRMQDIPLLAAFSPSVFPKPMDWGWQDSVAGYLFWSEELSKEEQLAIPAGLEAFLAAGPQPVYFGFGSMPAPNPEQLIKIVLDVVRMNSCRAILCAGWTQLANQEYKDVFVCEKVAHDWLFPKCSALVIHGGAGTTGAALRSGKPTMVCPVFADQPFWGRTVAKIGCGPNPVPFKDMNSSNVSEGLKFCQRPEVIDKARSIGEAIRGEWDSGFGAVTWIETVAVSVTPPIPKVASLGTGAILVRKLQGSGYIFRLLMALIVFLVYYLVFFR